MVSQADLVDALEFYRRRRSIFATLYLVTVFAIDFVEMLLYLTWPLIVFYGLAAIEDRIGLTGAMLGPDTAHRAEAAYLIGGWCAYGVRRLRGSTDV